jgi:hypothetical protein
VSFWSRGRRGRELDESPETVPGSAELAAVEFWAADQRTVAAVDPSQDRLTDLLNRGDPLSVVLLDGPPEDRSQRIAARPEQPWSQLEAGSSLLVLPPPQPSNPSRHLHRPRQPVEIHIGPFVVSGMVHVPPGSQAAAFLLRQNSRFAAVTHAAIRDGGLLGFEHRADVVLVNMRRIDAIQDVGLDERDRLVPPETSSPRA